MSEAIERRGLSLGGLRHQLRRRGHDLSVATLSYWRRGLARPTRASSFAAITALEEILELPLGTLERTLSGRARASVAVEPDAVALAETLGLAWGTSVGFVSIHDRILLDAEGRRVGHHVRCVVEAWEDGVDRYPCAAWGEGVADLCMEARSGCTIGRTARNASGVVAEVVLPRPLYRGESWLSEVSLVLRGSGPPLERWVRNLGEETRVVHYNVVFHPDAVPLSAESVVRSRGAEVRRPLVLRGPSLNLHLEDAGAVDAEITWSW